MRKMYSYTVEFTYRKENIPYTYSEKRNFDSYEEKDKYLQEILETKKDTMMSLAVYTTEIFLLEEFQKNRLIHAQQIKNKF